MGATSWLQACGLLAEVKAVAARRNAGQSLTIVVGFAGCRFAPEGLSLVFRLFVTAEGVLISEDRRVVRSLGQAIAWANYLRLTCARLDPGVKRNSVFIAELADIPDGIVVPPPPMVATDHRAGV